MWSKVFALITVAFFMTACAGLQPRGSGSSSVATNSIATKYTQASADLEPFTVIPGSKTGARASDRVFFGFDSAVLTADAQRTLDRQANWLKDNATRNVSVEGHCDERGTREYNLALGERRAIAVKNYLVASGVQSNRIQVISYGKERPAVLGSNSAAWAENRRSVTIVK